ncbi:hypothetical protein LSH36_314g00017 [Paralvinella palmiformis]|uniref:Uncharacterized protein n=1 Tax=Paralvinella palmiformis TaxID=53620 RepID=A0AAD9JH77_9ANNE|nr:hypothetical protein LSH36_314g00017 [Paralvinella palmiformis]
MQLHAMGFKFLVLPDVFIVHMPHSRNYEKWFIANGLDK